MRTVRYAAEQPVWRDIEKRKGERADEPDAGEHEDG
jgi:hypothetical protein